MEPRAGRYGRPHDTRGRLPERHGSAHRSLRRTASLHGPGERAGRLDRGRHPDEGLLMKTSRLGAAGVLAVLLLVCGVGCGLFKPRDPRPGGGPGVNCATPNSPDNVVANVANHYAELAGVSCYTDMLDTSFVFHPDAADSIEAGTDTVFAHWTHDVEARDAANVAGNAKFHVASFDSEYAARFI